MELRLLEYFLTVVREENISKAAEVLHVTQPTLSRQMKELEDELGTTLFIRGKRLTSFTSVLAWKKLSPYSGAAGKFLEYIKSIYSEQTEGQ